MKTKLSELFFEPAIEEMPKILLQAFAVTPIPEGDFIKLTDEFKLLKNKDEVSFIDSIIVDKTLIDIILKSSKRNANFCFIERENNISLMLHLSDLVASLDSGDEVYSLDGIEIGGMKVYNLVKSTTPIDYLNEKKNYELGLGDYINGKTNMVNTRIVSYEKDDIALFNFNSSKYYSAIWDHFKYVKISFIIFKRIKESVLDAEYKKRLGRLSIAMQYCFETEDGGGTVISLSNPSDITSLWP
ncbi:hypothetical protein [Chryseobacterium jejuense]|uniref:Uncharacterized protein n=1 Tax=Chryseobacterium jejuense TaxID=445960 RepID=A0A2X2X273_CHRJE|nr:hypothetical protein [Chryseobacterium jejuense]SDI52915.1 hypothetical protein SAMN05421542_1201 [Chryseobacterium jejuense]SQB46938.1 Uncharacterised protein [Chryseobacterium jejuense]